MPKDGKGKFMKKNIFKKIVASLATAAMAVGMFAAAPAQEDRYSFCGTALYTACHSPNQAEDPVCISNFPALCKHPVKSQRSQGQRVHTL